MFRSIGFLPFFLLVSFQCVGQVAVSIDPVWEKSFGRHDHTSRDVLTAMLSDSSGNLILVGFTESDSNFSDILIQKVTSAGDLIWEFQYSSGLGLDYDVPIYAFINHFNEISVVGRVVTNAFSSGYGFVFQCDANGELQWKIDLTEVVPPHDYFQFFDAYQDTSANLWFTYTPCHLLDGLNQTYFFTISREGVLQELLAVDGVCQPTGGGPFATSVSHDHSGTFVFTIWDEFIHQRYLRKINPHTPSDTTLSVNTQALSGTTLQQYDLLEWEDVRLDSFGNLYTVSNFGISGPDRFLLLKLDSNAVVKYLFVSQPGNELSYEDILIVDSNVLVVGANFQPNEPIGFLWRLNQDGTVQQTISLTASGGLIPSKLVLHDETLLVMGANASTGKGFIRAFQSSTFQNIWSRNLNSPSYHLFYGENAIVNGSTVYVGGTSSGQKYQGSVFLSEQDFYLEAFVPGANTPLWTHTFNGTGTSHVIFVKFAVDPVGNVLLIARENAGPEPSFLPEAPQKLYLYKFSGNGTQEWIRQLSANDVDQTVQNSPMRFDSQNNLCFAGQLLSGGSVLYKYSPEGELLDSLLTGPVSNFQFAANDQIGLITVQPDGIKQQWQWLDQQLNVQSIIPLPGSVLRIFRLPGSDDLYSLHYDRGAIGLDQEMKFYLFKNGVQQWTRTILLGSVYDIGLLGDYDIDLNNGTLFFMSKNSAFSADPVFQSLQMGNVLTEVAYPVQDAGDVISKVICDQQGRYFLFRPNRIELFDNNANLINQQSFSFSGIWNAFIFRSYLFVAEQGNFHVFDGNGNYLARFENEGFTFSFLTNIIDSSYALYSYKIFGQGFPVNYFNYGWQWRRGALLKYSLENYLTALSSSKNDPEVADIILTCYPNPSENWCEFSIKGALFQRPVRIDVYDIQGRLHWSSTWTDGQSPVRFDCSNLLPGIYFAHAVSPDFAQPLLHLFIKQ